MHLNLQKSKFAIHGEFGLPESYPKPRNIDGLLFYVQRNLNKNTIAYTLNEHCGCIDKNYPIKVFWISYTSGGHHDELNPIQKKAFGYNAFPINNEVFEIQMTSYSKMRLFLDNSGASPKVITKIAHQDAILNNIYVFADEFGIFPQVKYIELYGSTLNGELPLYERINF